MSEKADRKAVSDSDWPVNDYQADKREAEHCPRCGMKHPAIEGLHTCKDNRASGSASQSTFQRKVAEAIVADAPPEGQTDDEVDRITAVLAFEGVVDPEVVYMLDKVRAERDKAETKVEQLEAQKERHLDLVPMAKAAGREQAAKKLELMARDTQPAHDIVLLNKAAAVIRERNITLDAEIEKLMAQLKEM